MAIINDGHATTIAFAESASGVLLTTFLKEKTVTPPGVSGGGENDTSTMRNSEWRTKQPKSLKTLTNSSFDAAYDPAVLDEIMETVNVNQQITITFPDGSTWTFWGWLDEFTPNANEEGAQPTAGVIIIPSNQDAAGAEIAPVYAAAA